MTILVLVRALLLAAALSAEPIVDISKESTRSTNNEYFYQIHNYKAPAAIVTTLNGTFFQGNFSTLLITTRQRTYSYTSTGFSFKSPPQHRVVPINTPTIEMHVHYELTHSHKLPWKHRQVVLVVTFVETDQPLPSAPVTSQLLQVR